MPRSRLDDWLVDIARGLRRRKEPRPGSSTTTTRSRHDQLVAWVRLKLESRGGAREETDPTTGHTTFRDAEGRVLAIVGTFSGGLTRFDAPWPEVRRANGEPFNGS